MSLYFDTALMSARRCYTFSVLPCAVAAVEGDTLHQIGHNHGVSYVDMLLINTHLQARPNLLHPGDIVATAVAHQIEFSCSIRALADALLLTPQRLRCGFLHLPLFAVLNMHSHSGHRIPSLLHMAMISWCMLV